MERVVPRLNHANAAVVLSAIKVVLVCIDKMDDPKSTKQLVQKLSAPLVSMMSSAHGQSPEIQYVALRNIALIVQKQPKVLMNDVKIFSVRTTIRSTSRWKSWRFLFNLPRA